MKILDFWLWILDCSSGGERLSDAKHDVPFERFFVGRWALLFVLLLPLSASAYPPAPPHTIYGVLRDEMGDPMAREDARVVFESENGVTFTTRLVPGLAPGVNYEILVPMDAGITPDLYRPSAMSPLVPFRLKVIVGRQTYLPIEMSGDLRQLGEPAGSTRLDLTLGLDSDGDGLPDAWKDMVIAMMGGGLTRAEIRPGDDLDGDGFTNLQEYIAGTYAWDPHDRLALEILHVSEGRATLEFLAINGRSYHIEASDDLKDWQQVNFHIPAVDAPGVERATYFAHDVRRREVEVQSDPEQPVVAFRLVVR